jgi:hypothetical protein
MLNPLHRSGPQRNLELAATQSRPHSQQSDNVFHFDDLAASASGPTRPVAPVSSVPSSKRQAFGTGTSTRQVIVAASAPQTSQRNSAIVSAPAASSTTTPKLSGDAAVLQSLKDALAAAGINTDGLGLATHQDVVSYPGGSYINRYISVETNGHEEGLMTDLVGINPNVAVLDIKHMLGRG